MHNNYPMQVFNFIKKSLNNILFKDFIVHISFVVFETTFNIYYTLNINDIYKEYIFNYDLKILL